MATRREPITASSAGTAARCAVAPAGLAAVSAFIAITTKTGIALVLEATRRRSAWATRIAIVEAAGAGIASARAATMPVTTTAAELAIA